MRHVNKNQLEAWLGKLQTNIQAAKLNKNMTPEEKLTFIQKELVLLDVVVKVLNGKAYFTGCAQPPKSN